MHRAFCHRDTVFFFNIYWQRQCVQMLSGSSVARVAQEKENVGLCSFPLAAIIRSLKPMCLHVPWKKTNEFYFLHWRQFELSTGGSDAIGAWFIMPHSSAPVSLPAGTRQCNITLCSPHPQGWESIHTKENKLIMQIISINNQYEKFIQAIS